MQFHDVSFLERVQPLLGKILADAIERVPDDAFNNAEGRLSGPPDFNRIDDEQAPDNEVSNTPFVVSVATSQAFIEIFYG